MIEMLVYITVFVFVMLALVMSVRYFYRTSNYSIQQAQATASAQRGIDKAVRIARGAAYADNGAYPIISFGPNDLKFYANIDADASIEKMHYYVASTTASWSSLIEGVINASGDPAVYTAAEANSTLSNYVHNLDQGVSTFTYYDQNGVQITDYTKIGDVRYVTINLTVDIDPNRTPTILTLRSSAALRNLVGK